MTRHMSSQRRKEEHISMTIDIVQEGRDNGRYQAS